MIMLKLCKLLPCNVSKLFFRYHGCNVSIKDLIFRLFGQKYDFLHFWTDDCSLKRAKCRNYGLCTLTGSLKHTGKQTARLQARLSVEPLYSTPWKTSLWSRVPCDAFLANHYNFITSISKTFNIKSIICVTLCDSLIKCMSNIHKFNEPCLS